MAKKITTYTQLLNELGNGILRSASEVQRLIKPYAIFRLNLEEENKVAFDKILAAMEKESAEGTLAHQKRPT